MSINDQDYSKGMRDAQFQAEKFNADRRAQFTEEDVQKIAYARLAMPDVIPSTITLRDRMAMATYPSVVANVPWDAQKHTIHDWASRCWELSYQIADMAMLAARKGKKP